jgi:hypothetical protein
MATQQVFRMPVAGPRRLPCSVCLAFGSLFLCCLLCLVVASVLRVSIGKSQAVWEEFLTYSPPSSAAELAQTSPSPAGLRAMHVL